jgi:hypothetical protein|nr:MAG TPA: hypothetical protein [Caudoviricetes sp.]
MEQEQQQTKVKNAKLIFEEGADYEFNVEDLPKALAYAKEKNWPLVAVKTPWYWLSVLDDETGETAFNIFK